MEVLIGFMAGFALSLPLGPMGTLGAIRIFYNQVKPAYALAAGACIADTLLAAFAIFAASKVKTFAEQHELGLTIVLVAMLTSYGLYSFLNAHKELKEPKQTASFAYGIGFTLIHPGNVTSFTTAFIALQQSGVVIEGTVNIALTLISILVGSLFAWHLYLQTAQKLQKLFLNKLVLVRKFFALSLLVSSAYLTLRVL